MGKCKACGKGKEKSTPKKYEVIVGNIGTVYSGNSKAAAQAAFNDYVELSKGDYGRAGSEMVTLFEDDYPDQEFVPKNSDNPLYD